MSASSAAFFVFLHEAQAPIIITANADAINVDIVFIVVCFFVGGMGVMGVIGPMGPMGLIGLI